MSVATFDTVKEAARGRWPELLAGLGINPAALRNRHGPCPGCGGKDRFRFDDKGVGRFYCNGGGEPATGDGFALLQHVHGCTAREALERVTQSVGMDAAPMAIAPPRAPGKPPPPSRTETYAREVWLRANSDDHAVGSHPYAIKKGIGWAAGAGRATVTGQIVGRDSDCIVIPIRTPAGKLLAIQAINTTGDKQTFGRMGDDGCLLLGNTLDGSIPWVVVEGWADAVSVAFHVYRGNAVAAAAFGINRMDKVARAIADYFQPPEIVILEDAA